MTSYFIQAAIYLFVAVFCVLLAKRLGLGSVLGYLIAGLIIGPITGIAGDETETIQHFAEFGVVMMLFVVGLELSPKALWNMKHQLLGLGGLQITLTTAIITALGVALDFPWQTSLLAIPAYFGMPEVATVATGHASDISLVDHLSGLEYVGAIILAITLIIVLGHYTSKPLFTLIAKSGLREMYTATALLLVIAIAALMSVVGLSPALGTFLAGVVLANSEFRHELESNIQPFKALLLGLFFVTVGAGISFAVVFENALLIGSLTLAVIVIKALVLLALAVIFKIKKSDGWLLALSLAQAGEFGFVVLSFSSQSQALPEQWVAILSPVITLSMFFTPLLFIFYDKVITQQYLTSQQKKEADPIDKKGQIIIAGIGRFGQVINRLLTAHGFETTVIDQSTAIIDRVKRVDMHAYYGDATNSALLDTAGIEDASLFVIAIDDKERVVDLVKYIRQFHPHLPIVARAYDRGHAYALEAAGADHVFVETYHTALEMGKRALQFLGLEESQAEKSKDLYFQAGKEHHQKLREAWTKANEKSDLFNNYIEMFISLEKEMRIALQKRFNEK